MAKKPTLCQQCGAFIRMTWTEQCGACGADIVFAETVVEPVNTEGLSRSMVAMEWLSRPRNVIVAVVATIVLACLATIAFALSTINSIGIAESSVRGDVATAEPAAVIPAKSVRP